MLAGADRRARSRASSCRCPESPTKITLSRSSIQEPSASAAIVACGIFGLSSKRKSSRRLIAGNRASISRRRSRRSARSAISASSSAARYATGVCCSRTASVGQRSEPAADGREFQLDRVRLDQRFQRRGLSVAGGAHRAPLRRRAAGRSRSRSGSGRSCSASRAASPSSLPAGVGCWSGGREQRRRVRRSRPPRARREPRARRGRGRARGEQQNVDHLPGGLRAAVSSRAAVAHRSSKQLRPAAAVALLGQRQRSGERAGLAGEQLEVVVEAARGCRTCRAAAHGGRPLASRWVIRISAAPIRSDDPQTRPSDTGTE